MSDDDIKPNEWINAREILAPPKVRREPVVDIPVSKAVCRKIIMNSPEHRKVVETIAGWNRKRDPEDLRPHDYLKDEQKVKELKKVLGV